MLGEEAGPTRVLVGLVLRGAQRHSSRGDHRNSLEEVAEEEEHYWWMPHVEEVVLARLALHSSIPSQKSRLQGL